MRRVLALAVAAFVSAALATPAVGAPSPAKREICNVGPPDPDVRDEIYRVALDMRVNDKVMLAMMATAIVESDVNNLRCGDKDSVGVFQQRPSQDWGTVDQILNIDYSTRRFLELCVILDRRFPNIDAGSLAQLVQRAEAGNKYTAQLGHARQLLQAAAESVGRGGPRPTAGTTFHPGGGGGGTSDNGGPTATSGDEPTATFPTPTPATASPDYRLPAVQTLWVQDEFAPRPSILQKVLMPSAVVARVDPTLDASANTADRNRAAQCLRAEYARPGDSCIAFAGRYAITLDAFMKMNPRIDDDCLNLDVHRGWCIEEVTQTA